MTTDLTRGAITPDVEPGHDQTIRLRRFRLRGVERVTDWSRPSRPVVVDPLSVEIKYKRTGLGAAERVDQYHVTAIVDGRRVRADGTAGEWHARAIFHHVPGGADPAESDRPWPQWLHALVVAFHPDNDSDPTTLDDLRDAVTGEPS